jgi:predicted transcriptional regulator
MNTAIIFKLSQDQKEKAQKLAKLKDRSVAYILRDLIDEAWNKYTTEKIESK